MATNKAVRTAVNADSIVRQIQNALDLAERTLSYIATHDVATEVTALEPGAIVTGDLDRERVIDLVTLSANLAFYLRGVDNGAGQTIIGTAPLTAPQLAALVDKLGI